ncbi:MAG TPA: aminotransferase class I/II-fold pyridoxal phosphate-dependent enzyme [Cellulomonas sp.]
MSVVDGSDRTAVAPFDVPLEDLRARTSEKWRRYPPDVLPLFVAEMDVVPPEPVVRAVHDALSSGDTGYEGDRGYVEAFSAFADQRWGWAVDPGTARLVPDVMQGIVHVLRLLTGPGDAVVIAPPVYPPFRSFVEHSGRRIVTAPLTPAGRLDLEALDRAFGTAKAGGHRAVFLLCQPHNPTGVLHTADEVAALGELAADWRVRVVADEIHAALVPPRPDGTRPAFTPTTTVIPDAIALHSGSKAFNLAGLKAAVAVPGPQAAQELALLPQLASDGVSHIASIAHQAGFRHGGPWLDGLLDALAGNVQLVGRLLAERVPRVRWTPPEATYLAWLDLRDAGVPDGVAPADFLLAEARVATVDGRSFGAEGDGFVRLNLATSRPLLDEALGRIATALP